MEFAWGSQHFDRMSWSSSGDEVHEEELGRATVDSYLYVMSAHSETEPVCTGSDIHQATFVDEPQREIHGQLPLVPV